MSQSIVNNDTTSQTDVPVEEVDLLVVGGGKADKPLAILRAKIGNKVVMVKWDRVSGTYINVARIPTKTLISATRILREAQGLQAYDATLFEQNGGADALVQARIELAPFRIRKEVVVDGMVAAHEKVFPISSMDFVKDTTHFVEERTVEIALSDSGLWCTRGAKVLINTGAMPSVPPIEDLSDMRYWTSEGLLTLPELPSSLIVLGGGVIGIEMASLMELLDIPVTIVHAGSHILDREDEDVATEVAVGLEAPGVTILTRAHASEVAAVAGGNGVVVTTADGYEVSGSHLFIALGCTPVIAGLGLETAGVELTECGSVYVDDHLRTTAENIHAAGDVTGTPQLIHISQNDFHVLRNLSAGKETSITGYLTPWAVFITLELGCVGMSEAEARKAGCEIYVAKTPTATVSRVKTLGHTEGFSKIIIDASIDFILSAAIIGTKASKVITSIQMMMLGDLTWQQVCDTVITHLIMSEGLNIILDSLG